MAERSDSQLQDWIAAMNAGEVAARARLIEHTCDRLHRLARKLLRDFPRLRRWEDSNDVLQNALLRLLGALQSQAPETVADYFRLATRQLRRELLDLTRHYYGPQGLGANHASHGSNAGPDDTPPPQAEPSDSTNDPGRLAAWGEFHERVAALAEPEREVFELLWYHGLTQAEAAEVLCVSVPTVKRRWLAARLDLQEALRGGSPDVCA
jgi:RNA polymerase sigma-70 factor (ECF subfamily)